MTPRWRLIDDVPGAGLEPAQPFRPKDFKSFVSTIPPSGRLAKVGNPHTRLPLPANRKGTRGGYPL